MEQGPPDHPPMMVPGDEWTVGPPPPPWRSPPPQRGWNGGGDSLFAYSVGGLPFFGFCDLPSSPREPHDVSGTCFSVPSGERSGDLSTPSSTLGSQTPLQEPPWRPAADDDFPPPNSRPSSPYSFGHGFSPSSCGSAGADPKITWDGMENRHAGTDGLLRASSIGNLEERKKVLYWEAVMRPVNLGPETPCDRPKRKHARLSDDPQTIAARRRRNRINDRLWVLKKLVPGGTSMDTATMLDEASNYLRFLKSQLRSSEDTNNLRRSHQPTP